MTSRQRLEQFSAKRTRAWPPLVRRSIRHAAASGSSDLDRHHVPASGGTRVTGASDDELPCEGPPPRFADYLEHVRACGNLVPPLLPEAGHAAGRRRASCCSRQPELQPEVPSRSPRAVRQVSESELLRLASRIASRRLDHSKPPWESWLVNGPLPASFLTGTE